MQRTSELQQCHLDLVEACLGCSISRVMPRPVMSLRRIQLSEAHRAVVSLVPCSSRRVSEYIVRDRVGIGVIDSDVDKSAVRGR